MDDKKSYIFQFTEKEILDIIEHVNRRPVNKSKVLDLLLKGKKEV